MEISKAIEILRTHNKWRRGGEGEMQYPQDIGEAIDTAIEFMECMTVKPETPMFKLWHGK